MSNNRGTAASLRERWLGIHNSYKTKETDKQQQQQQHLQVLQKFHQQQQHHRQNETQQNQPQPQPRHWDLRPFGVNWDDEEEVEDSVGDPPLLRSWQNAEEWLPPPKPVQHHPPPPPPPPTTLFPMTPRQQQQQQLASIHRSQRISELAAMLIAKEQDDTYSSVRLKKDSNQQASASDDHQPFPSPVANEEPSDHIDHDENTDHDNDADDDHDPVHSPPPLKPPATKSRAKNKQPGVESSHRRILQLAPMHSRPTPPPQQPQAPTTSKATNAPKPSMYKTTAPKTTKPMSKPKQPSPFSYPTYWSDNEGRKLDIYQRSMLRLQERERRLEQRRRELAKENCTFAPKLRTVTLPTSSNNPATPLAAATPPSTVMATTPTTTETTTTTTTTTSSTTSTTAASKASVTSPAASRETVFERLYRRQTKEKAARAARNVPKTTTAATAATNYNYRWASNSISRPGTDGNNSWVSSSVSSKLDYLDGTTRRTGTTGTHSETEAKLLRRRRLEEREMAECTFHPRLNWGKELKGGGVTPGIARVPTKTSQNVSPLSDGEASKETMARRLQQSRQRQPSPPQAKRLPREILTTNVAPILPRNPAQTSQQGRTAQIIRQPVVSPLRDPPATMQRRRVTEANVGVRNVPPPVSPTRIPPKKRVTESNKRAPGSMEHRPAVTSPLRDPAPATQLNKVVESNKRVGGISHPPHVRSPVRVSPTAFGRKRATDSTNRQNASARHSPMANSICGSPPTQEQQQMSRSSRWGTGTYPPPVACPRADSPMTIERKKAAESRKIIESNKTVSQLSVSPRTPKQDTFIESAGVYSEYVRNPPIINLPDLPSERNMTVDPSRRVGDTSKRALPATVVRASSVMGMTSNKASCNAPMENVIRGTVVGLDKMKVEEMIKGNADFQLRTKGLATDRTPALDAYRRLVSSHHPTHPLRSSPKTQEQLRRKPPLPLEEDDDDDDVAILPPALARRAAPTYPFHPLMGVPRVIYSESLASESVVSGRTESVVSSRTVDTEYGSI